MALLEPLIYPLAFLVAIGILVTIHEFGHFWVAQTVGIKVLRFSIGFGKPIWSRRFGRDRTELVLSALPLGGYVKMLDEREGEVAEEERHRAFNRQSIPARAAVVVAGPAFNFLFAIFAFWLMFGLGVEGQRPILGELAAESALAQAGAAAGDEVVSVNEKPTRTWEELRIALYKGAFSGGSQTLQVRDEAGYSRTLTLTLAPDLLRDEEDLFERIGLKAWRPTAPPVLRELIADGAAQRDGLQPGDRVLEIDGVAARGADGMIEIIQAHPEEPLRFLIERDERQIEITVRPKAIDKGGERIGQIGAQVANQIDQAMQQRLSIQLSYAPLEALAKGASKCWEMSSLTVRMLWKLVTGQASLNNLSGPITIAEYAGKSASLGPEVFLHFLAVVSISLGVINLMPIPILDGGHLLFLAIEWVNRGPLSEQAEAVAMRIGMLLLATLMGIAFYSDIVRLLG